MADIERRSPDVVVDDAALAAPRGSALAGPPLLGVAVVALPLVAVSPILSGIVALIDLGLSSTLLATRRHTTGRGLLVASAVVASIGVVIALLMALLTVQGFEVGTTGTS